MEHSGLFIFKFLCVLPILANLHPLILAARSVTNGCKAGNDIKVSWNSPPDYETFRIQVENACKICDTHNVIVHLKMLAPGIWNPVDEKVIVHNGKSIRPGQKLTFTYHVNYLADISSAQPSAKFINCK
ncbi:hypothetical protein SUGI_0789060 [Cryptomeria japonica]|uniref:uncharacterized protein LOC131047054 n=1 Tax=Cryptomeria japonica TaxID=3369 RepID=UPI002414CA7A|nr:uncharacterized protein LOC131047054 [Cryptomeria japonica]GLJ38713.1 hypothetical protein SUGI_0789060 [Cryptomeria japonica]